jgi:hypothetical protein
MNHAVASFAAPTPNDRQERRMSRKKRRNGGSVITGRASLSHNPEVVRWTRERYIDGMDREAILEASRAGTHGWPVAGRELSPDTLREVRAAIKALEWAEAHTAMATNRKGNPSGRSFTDRRNELRQRLARGDYNALITLQQAVSGASQQCTFVKLADYKLSDVNVWAIADLHADLMDLAAWSAAALGEAQSWLSDTTVLAKIAYMEQVTAENGASEGEVANALYLADLMRRKLNARLTSTTTNGS